MCGSAARTVIGMAEGASRRVVDRREHELANFGNDVVRNIGPRQKLAQCAKIRDASDGQKVTPFPMPITPTKLL